MNLEEKVIFRSKLNEKSEKDVFSVLENKNKTKIITTGTLDGLSFVVNGVSDKNIATICKFLNKAYVLGLKDSIKILEQI